LCIYHAFSPFVSGLTKEIIMIMPYMQQHY
jgi:hypothetical protein